GVGHIKNAVGVSGAQIPHADDRPAQIQDAVVGPQAARGKIDARTDGAKPVQGATGVGGQDAEALNRAAGNRVGIGRVVAAIETERRGRGVDIDYTRRPDGQSSVGAAVAVVVDRAVHVDVRAGKVIVDRGVAVVGDRARGIDGPALATADVDG